MTDMYKQTAPEVAASDMVKEDKSSSSSSSSSLDEVAPVWSYALSKWELTPESDSILQWLARFPIENNHPRDLSGTVSVRKANGEVMVVTLDESLDSAWKKLMVEGFLGCPVISEKGHYVTYIELNDIVTHICNMFRAWSSDIYYVPDSPLLKQGWKNFFAVDYYLNRTVRELVFSPDIQMARPICYPAYRGFSTLWALEQMARLACHRVPILNSSHCVSGILTQSMLISLIDQNIHRLGDFRFTKVHEITGGLYQEVKCVQEESTALTAFKTMSQLGISGLGVVNMVGVLTDAITVRDLRVIGSKAEHFERLWHTVKRFKEEARRQFPAQTPAAALTCTINSTIEDVVKRFNDGNISRVFVVDSLDMPLFVITHCDTLRLILYKCGLEPSYKLPPLPESA